VIQAGNTEEEETLKQRARNYCIQTSPCRNVHSRAVEPEPGAGPQAILGPEPKSFERWSRNLKFEFPVNTEQDCFEWSVLNGLFTWKTSTEFDI